LICVAAQGFQAGKALSFVAKEIDGGIRSGFFWLASVLARAVHASGGGRGQASIISPSGRNSVIADYHILGPKLEDQTMRTWTSLLVAAPVAVGLLAAPAAHADWGHRGGWHGYERHHDHRGGIGVAGALVGLGIAAAVGGVIAATQAPAYYAPPPVVYAPPPGYYPAPAYAAPPGYYAPPPYAP
jgi:hypothetical protein